MIYPGYEMGHSHIEGSQYYPPLPFRFKPEWYQELPESYQHILDEVYQALDSSRFFLASIGTRTALDQLVVEKIGDVGTFKDKVERLCSTGFIDTEEKDMLLIGLDTGSASAHRGYKPDHEQMKIIMNILEAIFQKLLVAPLRKEELMAEAKALRGAIPKRQRSSQRHRTEGGDTL